MCRLESRWAIELSGGRRVSRRWNASEATTTIQPSYGADCASGVARGVVFDRRRLRSGEGYKNVQFSASG